MENIPDDILAAPQQDMGEKSILIMTADDTEDIEFLYPYYRFIEEGYNVDVATPEGYPFKGKRGYTFTETKKISDAVTTDYDLLYIPGGKAPAALAKNEDALNLVQEFALDGKPIAALCHGPQVLAAAKVISGVKIAAWPEIANEVTQAGASFVSDAAVVDGLFITGRWPADLPDFTASTLDVLHSQELEGAEIHAPAEQGKGKAQTV
jgi:protease I